MEGVISHPVPGDSEVRDCRGVIGRSLIVTTIGPTHFVQCRVHAISCSREETGAGFPKKERVSSFSLPA
jgi:hypothetical protein